MFKIRFSKVAAAALLVAISATQTMAGGPACGAGGAFSLRQSIACPATLLPIRDQQSAGAGGGGNSCWSSCFNNFNECVGMRPKPHCVATMKLCLETCDRLSNRPGT